VDSLLQKIKKIKMKNILLILTIILLSGCGIRKVDKSNTKIEKEVTIDQSKETIEVSKTIENKETENNSVFDNDIVFEELDIVPIDTTKAISITTPDGKFTKFENAKISSRKTIDKSKTTKKDKSIENKTIDLSKAVKEKAKIKAKDKLIVAKKESMAKHFNWWWLLLLLIIPVARWGYNRYKNSNPLV
jgi:hypothetical protein